MEDRLTRALLRLWKYEANRKQLYPGRRRKIDYEMVAHYAREIERALKKAGPQRLDELTIAASPADVAKSFMRIPRNLTMFLYPIGLRTTGWHEPVQSVLLGGWDHRDKDPGRTLPELVFKALDHPERPIDSDALLRYIAESVAAPAIWPNTSLEYSRRVCRRIRRARQKRRM